MTGIATPPPDDVRAPAQAAAPDLESGDLTAYVCGINHERADLDTRERFALDADGCRAVLARLRDEGLAEEGLVLSTCNRTEIYALHPLEPGFGRRLADFFDSIGRDAGERGGKTPLYNYDGLEATRHFFAVNTGLNSLILGENEIKGQLRSAFELSRSEVMAGPQLHRLMEWSNRCAKRIKTETDLNRGTLCYGRASILKAEATLGSLEGRVGMIIGAGKVGRAAAQALAARRPARLLIANRTARHAEEVAEGLNAEIVALADIPNLIPECDLILGAAFAPNFIVTRAMYEAVCGSRPASRPVCIIDAAVPRILERSIGEIPGVTLFDLGDLEEIVATHRDERHAAARRAWKVVEEEVAKYQGEQRVSRLGPLIDQLRERFDRIAGEIDGEHGPGADGDTDPRARHRLKQRLLHEAIRALKQVHRDGR